MVVGSKKVSRDLFCARQFRREMKREQEGEKSGRTRLIRRYPQPAAGADFFFFGGGVISFLVWILNMSPFVLIRCNYTKNTTKKWLLRGPTAFTNYLQFASQEISEEGTSTPRCVLLAKAS